MPEWHLPASVHIVVQEAEWRVAERPGSHATTSRPRDFINDRPGHIVFSRPGGGFESHAPVALVRYVFRT